MDRPALPSLVSLVHVRGCQPQVVPLRGLPDWYAIAIPAGHPAYIVSPDADGPVAHARAGIEALLDHAAKAGHDGLSYGMWTVRVTRGAWIYLESIKGLLADILGMKGILPLEPGAATMRDRARIFARTWAKRLLAPPARTVPSSQVPAINSNSAAGTLPAPRASFPAPYPAGTGNGELVTSAAEPPLAPTINADDVALQEEA